MTFIMKLEVGEIGSWFNELKNWKIEKLED
jgi:hypothetical protein